jgi:hypothetical protein
MHVAQQCRHDFAATIGCTRHPGCFGVLQVKVRLTKKLADAIDDVSLARHRVGDVMDLAPREAELLIAERWAIPERRSHDSSDCDMRRRREDLERA